ncbi:MAG: tyrosine-type recombinase/integrase [Ruminococcus sp.]|nr:tyrosine-type recombinase/integrase [Ruminococcus sp.]
MAEFNSVLSTYMYEMLEYRAALGYSKKTYYYQLLSLDRFISEKYPQATTITQPMITDWLLPSPKDKLTTRKRRARIARIFSEYLNSVGIDAYMVPKGYVNGKRFFKPLILTDEELSDLFEQIDRIDNPAYDILKRATAAVMFRLIYTCGLRPGEALRLRKENIDLATGEIHIVETKCKKERIVVMSSDMLALMKRFTLQTVLSGRNSVYVFSNPDGEPYSSSWAQKIIKTCLRKANPDTPDEQLPCIRTYDLRHRFASATLCRWLDEGKNLYNMLPYLRTYMGHNSLTDTARYIHILPENLLRSKGIDWRTVNSAIPEAEEWDD